MSSMKLFRLSSWLSSDPNGAIALVRRVFSEAFRDHLAPYIFALACMAMAAATTAASAWLMRYPNGCALPRRRRFDLSSSPSARIS